jgi:hypothetical protein
VVQRVGVVQLHLHGTAHEYRGSFPFCAQQSRHVAALVVLDELTGEFLFHALALFAAGQQQKAFHLHQMRRHLNEGAGSLGVGVGLLHGTGVLVDELQNGDVVQIHLMLGHQRQQ